MFVFSMAFSCQSSGLLEHGNEGEPSSVAQSAVSGTTSATSQLLTLGVLPELSVTQFLPL